MYKHKVLPKGSELRLALKRQFAGLHESRLKFLVIYTLATIATRTVDAARLAGAFQSEAEAESSKRRIERFLASFSMDYAMFARALAALSGQQGRLRLAMDRTNWKFGSRHVNVLTLAACQDGMAFPLMFRVLSHRGNSDCKLRIEIMEEFLAIFGPEKVEWLAADREFVGKDWLGWLREKGISYYIRIKSNQYVVSGRYRVKAACLFRSLRPQGVGRWDLDGEPVFLRGMRLEDGDTLIVACWEDSRDALAVYRQRWQIETMFRALKSRGFNLEDSHIADPGRMRKLLTLLAIAFIWACRAGAWLNARKPVAKVRLGTGTVPEISLFSLGIAFISRAIIVSNSKTNKQLRDVSEILSAT